MTRMIDAAVALFVAGLPIWGLAAVPAPFRQLPGDTFVIEAREARCQARMA